MKTHPRLSIVISDGPLYFSKKGGSGRYCAMDIGEQIPSPDMLEMYFEHLVKAYNRSQSKPNQN